MVIGGKPVGSHFHNPYDPRSAYEARDLVCFLALQDVGLSDPAPYWLECGVLKPFPKHWCGAFALTVLHRAGLCDYDWEIGKGFLYRLPMTNAPQPGDILYFSKHQHHAIWIGDIEGRIVNGNGAGGYVTVTHAEDGKHGATAVYSIGRLVEKYNDPR